MELRLSRERNAPTDCGHGTGDRGILVTATVPGIRPCYSCYGGDPECSECEGSGQAITQSKVTLCARCAVRKFDIRIHDNEPL